MRGSPVPGEELSTFINQLKEMVMALQAVNDYPDASFIDTDAAGASEKDRKQ